MESSEDAKAKYKETREDLLARSLSNSEAHDKAILSLSSAFLAISVAFIKDIVPLSQLSVISILFVSWALFGCAIVSTIASFIFGQAAINRQLDYAAKYYLENKEEYFSKRNSYSTINNWLNKGSGISFIIAVILTIVFAIINIQGVVMTKKGFSNDSASIHKMQRIDSADVPKFQKAEQPATKKATAQNTGSASEKANEKKSK